MIEKGYGDRQGDRVKIYSRHLLIGKTFQEGILDFDDKIRSFSPCRAGGQEALGEGEILDLADSYLIPGLVDIHTHGAMGADASDGDIGGLKTQSLFYARDGVTSFCPTTMTLQEEDLAAACRTVRDLVRPEKGAKAAGIHLEGPFICMTMRGAQNPANIHKPDVDFLRRLQEEAGGLVRLITMAPETEGGIPFIREASRICAVSLGHTMADYDTAMEGFAAGASHVTHLFNAMSPLHHRMPGLIGAAYDAGASVELISDGMHVQAPLVRMTGRLFEGRLCLISDSLRCTGMPDGDYPFGGQWVTLKEGKATIRGTDTIAGSVISLMEGVRRVVSYGIPLEEAVLSASLIPARAIRMDGWIGSIEHGKAADLVALDRDLQVRSVWIDGKKIR